MTSEELAEHAAELCQSHGVRLFAALSCPTAEPLGGASHDHEGEPLITISAWPGRRWPYLLTLHELGHHCQPVRWGAWSRLREEAHAWTWALEHSLIKPRRTEWARILDCLRSYGDDRRFKRDDDFERLLSEAERRAA